MAEYRNGSTSEDAVPIACGDIGSIPIQHTTKHLKINKIMKIVLQLASLISTGLSVGESWRGEIDKATFFLVWAFYFKYLSDKE